MTTIQIKTLSVAFLCALELGCGVFDKRSSSSSALSNNALFANLVVVDQALNSQAMGILKTRCDVCHTSSAQGNFGYVNDLNKMVSTRMIIPGSAATSKLYIRSSDGTMPPGTGMSASDLSILKRWIDVGLAIAVTPAPASVPSSSPPTAPAPAPAPAPVPSPVASSAPVAGLVIVDQALNTQAMGILKVHCDSCHGAAAIAGFSSVNDLNKMVTIGMILPGKSLQSKLYIRSADGTMPPGMGMNAADLDVLKRWIDMGLTWAGTAPPPPSAIVPLAATYTSISKNILVPKCVDCHGPTLARDGKRYDSYSYTMRTVVAGNASQSSLYTECQSGSMPRAPYTDLTTQELMVLRDWINAGAPNN